MIQFPDSHVALQALEHGLITPAQLVALCAEAGRRGVPVDALLADAHGIKPDSITEAQVTVGYEEDMPGAPVEEPVTAPLLALGLSPERFTMRYTLGDEIGRGGVGRVQEAQDALTGRTVAIKVLHAGSEGGEQLLRRFIAEAQTTAQLEHPNVVPIYDLGTLPDSSPYFSMKRVGGRALHQLLAKRATEAKADDDLYRWLQIFSQVCMAVDYAHSKGVVHRDLKPENIMVGDFGEVLLMDWGIAKTSRTKEAARDGVSVQITDPGEGTQHGSVIGTPGYMAPEQARNSSDVDHLADVWALGAILYEILTGCRPHEEATILATLIATAQKPVVSARERAPDRNIPEVLSNICAIALNLDPEQRYPGVRPLHDDVQRFVTGAEERQRRRVEVDKLLEDADESTFYATMLAEEAGTIDRELHESPALTGHEPIEEKRVRWALEDRRETVRREQRQAQFWIEARLLRAIQLIPKHEGCRRRLADHYWARYRQARGRHDAAAATEHLKTVAEYDDRRYHDRLAAQVPLRITSDPPGAMVVLHQYAESDRVLVAMGSRALGQTPLTVDSVPTGRLLLELSLLGRPTVPVPIMAWRGDELDLEVQIPTAEALGDEFVYVAGGPFLRGNDPGAVLAAPTEAVDLTPFAISRYPITCEQYAVFLNALDDTDRTRHATGLQSVFPPTEAWAFPCLDRDGDEWGADWPVCMVSYADVEAYVAWRAQRDGALYRLPTEDEWEKAARGTDGRVYPWGDRFDPTFCSARGCLPNNISPESVGAHRQDCSPYGVHDMAGAVREWTDGWFEHDLRSIRGGAWNLYPFQCRTASRYGAYPGRGQVSIGFRLLKIIDF